MTGFFLQKFLNKDLKGKKSGLTKKIFSRKYNKIKILLVIKLYDAKKETP